MYEYNYIENFFKEKERKREKEKKENIFFYKAFIDTNKVHYMARATYIAKAANV